jgi:hypothetical protein
MHAPRPPAGHHREWHSGTAPHLPGPVIEEPFGLFADAVFATGPSTKLIRTGDLIDVDGTVGVVTILEHP